MAVVRAMRCSSVRSTKRTSYFYVLAHSRPLPFISLRFVRGLSVVCLEGSIDPYFLRHGQHSMIPYLISPSLSGAFVLPLFFTQANEMGSELPRVDLAGRPAQAVCAGQSHTCVLLDLGEVACWGFNFYGQASDDKQ